MSIALVAAKNLFRHRLRTALTVAGVAVAIVAFILLRTVVWAWTVQTQDASTDRIVTRHKVTFVMSLPKRYVKDLKDAHPEVTQITWANWFGGREPNHEREFFQTLACDEKTFLTVYDEMKLPPEQLKAWQEDRQGAVVGEVIARKLGWKIGDKVRIDSTIFRGVYEFNVSGIYKATRRSVDNSTFLFHWDYFNDSIPERMRDQVGWIVSRVKDPQKAVETSLSIDRLFDERDIQTLSQDERTFNKSFLGMFAAVLTALDLVSLVILGIMMLILGNTVAMGVRERTGEYAVLRAIGFLPRHLAVLVLGEAGTLGALGGAAGLCLAYPVVDLGMGRFVEENLGTFFPFFRMTPENAATAFALAVALAALAAAPPAIHAYRLRVVDAIRRVA